MEVTAVEGLPEIAPDDDLAGKIESRADLADGDVLCVASTVVSKAEGRLYTLGDFPAGERAQAIAARLEALTGDEKDPRFAQAVLEESQALVLEEPFLLAVTRFGHIGVNAGIDQSNVPERYDLLLLPEDPSASAARLRAALSADVGVVVTDTSGRPFRHGQRGVAIGWAGLPAMRDWRGETDRVGYELAVTNEAVVDELAAAANLVFGEGDDGVPAAVVRGFEFGDHAGSDLLFRDRESDLVRQALEAWQYAGD
ncbi:MAG: coenzyme F420-0:L-glutamate ligase [Halobacteriales archaeon]|nr:coenzyme F420-0:L-glutamate ligase [Halobacteriales archaeon]